jgi:hypothetical protein
LPAVAGGRDASGAVISGFQFTWTSSDEALATVDSTGLVRGHDLGDATIRVAIGEVSAEAGVGVRAFPEVRHFGGEIGHTCFLDGFRQTLCFGRNDQGQLGTGNKTSSPTPIPTAGGLSFTALSTGLHHTCGLLASPTAYCWGSNVWEQLGYIPDETCDWGPSSTVPCSTVPTEVAGELAFTYIAAGPVHTCGSTQTGDAYCWGLNGSGQLGTGNLQGQPTPAAVVGGLTFRSITAGGGHTCGLSPEGAAYCWGSNDHGQLGDGSEDSYRTVPAPVAGGLEFASIDAGHLHTCATTLDQAAYCWGSNEHGKLGDGTTTDRGEPTAVAGGLSFGVVGAGNSRTCGLTPDGEAHCWGYPGSVLGGSQPTSFVPTRVSSHLTFASISVGGNGACGVSTEGAIYCHGPEPVYEP